MRRRENSNGPSIRNKIPKRTNQFQQLIHSIHLQLDKDAKVTESKFLRDLITGVDREVDIVIEVETPVYPMIIGVECSGKGRIATIEWVEQMIAKHRDLPTNKLVLVSKAGFTPQAINKAKTSNVETLTLTKAVVADWTKVVGKLTQVYVVLPQINVTHVAIFPPLDTSNIDVSALPFYTYDGKLLCNLLDIVDACRREPNVVEYIVNNFNEPGDYALWLERTITDGSYIIDKAGKKLKVERLRIAVVVHVKERIPVDLQHTLFKDIQVAYGTLNVDDIGK